MRAEFPTLNFYEQYLIDTARQIGLSREDGPNLYSEIQSWSNLTGDELSPWESETLMNFSVNYCGYLKEYADKNAAPPMISKEYRAILAKEYSDRRKSQLRNASKGK